MAEYEKPVEVSEAAEDGEAAELKSRGNAAYAQGYIEEAVRLWNRAIRRHVQELSDGKSCDEEAMVLERSIYLNLAQGYLKLGDAERALRACKVVLFGEAKNPKARYRAAEACAQLGRFDEAEQLLGALDPSEASRLLQRVKAEQRRQAVESRKQEAAASKKLAERMSVGLSGFSEEKPEPVPEEQRPRAPMADLDTVSNMTDVSSQAAQAAKARLARMEAASSGEPPLPEPTYTDFESFRAKAMKRSQRYTAATERSRRQTEAAKRSVRLDWLRQNWSGELEDFTGPLRQELQGIQAEELAQHSPTEDAALDAMD
ncbi:unnamed protein product [Effrenium voratum]|uniref:Tetratricopeptide repeat protein n=1 Tax=Effrenium voratum TaxID=2562239 RepID=A0AA36IGA5_9DINO|nr:unnamed protein product [Effrenium voratum]CAJ1457645.1 unnamed protein product [Effrenium voratum]